MLASLLLAWHSHSDNSAMKSLTSGAKRSNLNLPVQAHTAIDLTQRHGRCSSLQSKSCSRRRKWPVACSMPPRARCRGGCWPGWGSATIETWFHLLLACTRRSQLRGVRGITPGLLRSGGARSHLHDDVRVQTVALSEQGVWQGLDSRTQRHHGHAFRGGTQVAPPISTGRLQPPLHAPCTFSAASCRASCACPWDMRPAFTSSLHLSHSSARCRRARSSLPSVPHPCSVLIFIISSVHTHIYLLF